jgi:hypothetical protein
LSFILLDVSIEICTTVHTYSYFYLDNDPYPHT